VVMVWTRYRNNPQKYNAFGTSADGSAAMSVLTSTGFCRVNRRRPCLICGKPDWCSYTRDERISICMRVSDGARKINRHGVAIHAHEEDDRRPQKQFRSQTKIVEEVPQSTLAPIELRDFVYSTLIRLSPAANYYGSLIAAEKGLLQRGFSAKDFDNYGGLPPSFDERNRLVRQILKDAQSQFQIPDWLRGVPGFWEDTQGIHMWKPTDYRAPRLLIPVRDAEGRIQACQMRCPGTKKKGLRYCWLSSAGMPYGTGSGSPLHFTFRLSDLAKGEPIVIVEGALKADALYALRPDLHIVATAGVSANHEALIELTRGRRVLIAFDSDYHSNAAVCLRLASLIMGRWRSERTLASTRVAVWDHNWKGIDDAVLHHSSINFIGVSDWFTQLRPNFKNKVMELWKGIGTIAENDSESSAKSALIKVPSHALADHIARLPIGKLPQKNLMAPALPGGVRRSLQPIANNQSVDKWLLKLV
jgi:hypothetical protein